MITKSPNNSTEKGTSITADQVFEYLAENPDFFENRPGLLSHLHVPHQVEGGVSLVERQVKVLRDKNRELQGRLIDMLQSAQENEELLEKCIRLILCLIDCKSLEQLTNTLSDVLRREFDLDAVSITLVGHWQKVSSVRVLSDINKLNQLLDCRFPDNEPICGRFDKKLKDALFPSSSLSGGSVAVLPLGRGGKYGILTLMSVDQTRFSPDMGSLFLELISAVASQMLLKFKDF